MFAIGGAITGTIERAAPGAGAGDGLAGTTTGGSLASSSGCEADGACALRTQAKATARPAAASATSNQPRRAGCAGRSAEPSVRVAGIAPGVLASMAPVLSGGVEFVATISATPDFSV